MRRHPLLVLLSFWLLPALPAAAGPCAGDIAAFEGRLNDQAEAAISTSTGSKEVSAAREGQAVEARDKDVPVASVPQAPPAGSAEAQARQQAEAAGAGGDRVMQARATLNRARILDQEGNAEGCGAALRDAQRQLAQ